VQPVGFVEGVARFVAKDAPAFGLASALHLEHLATFELHQARMRQIEGNGKTKHALGIEEFRGKVDVRQRRNVAGLQLAVEPSNPALYQGTLDPNRKVAQTSGEESLIVGTLQG
jgi:hypothetical protein